MAFQRNQHEDMRSWNRGFGRLWLQGSMGPADYFESHGGHSMREDYHQQIRAEHLTKQKNYTRSSDMIQSTSLE